MNRHELKIKRRVRRKMHIRKMEQKHTDRLRLNITRSLKHIYAQIIDDVQGRTIVAASTLDKELREKINPGVKKLEQSKLVGMLIAKKAVEANIKSVAFDRNGFLYHGRVKALADGAREGGLEF